MEPSLIKYGFSSDERGSVVYINNLNFKKVKRTYLVSNRKTKTVRAWHGHKIEEKWVSVEEGEFLICLVKIDNFKKPDANSKVYEYILKKEDGILHIPKNYANGAMNLSKINSIRYFSSLSLEDSIKDDYRLDSKFWNPWETYKPNYYE